MTDAAAPLAQPATSRPDRAAGGELIACVVCDTLHVVRPIPQHGFLRCSRCGEVLLRTPGPTIDAVLATAFAISTLIVAAVFSPFLQIQAKGLKSSASLLDTAQAFSGGLTAPLAIAVIMMIVVVPVARAALLTYALLPLRLTGRLLPEAEVAFRFACELRPWSMAEVFIIGVVVALVKIGGMAAVQLGSGFWELVLIVAIVAIEGAMFDKGTLWRAIDQARRR